METKEIEDILIRHDEEIAETLRAYSALRAECEKALAEKISTFSETERAAIARFSEQSSSFERAMRAELRKTISETEKRAGALEFTIGQLRAELPSKVKEFAQTVAPAPAGFADVFQGELTADSVFKRGQIWGYKGGTYLARKDGRGEMPSPKSNLLPDSKWATIAAPGQNGSRGFSSTPPPSVQVGGGTGISTSAHSTANASGAFTVSPTSSIHHEEIALSGAGTTRSCTLAAPTGATAGSTASLRFRMPATLNLIVNIYDQSTGGTLLATVTCQSDGFTPASRHQFWFDGSAWQRDFEVTPANGQQT